MKKYKLFSFSLLATIIVVSSCSSKRDPGRIYMPDMAYSRAYEAYAKNDLQEKGINYINYPVEGTIKRGDLFPYTLTNDTNGYNQSAAVKNPVTFLTGAELSETQRLFNINCAICHGANMDAQGPLAVSGKVGGVANLKLPAYLAKQEGQMFHVMTYGKNNMGSYASQLTKQQRWMIAKYIKTVQQGAAPKTDSSATAKPAAAGMNTTTAAASVKTDSAATKNK
ncbi:cytochrome c [soil metagenome]